MNFTAFISFTCTVCMVICLSSNSVNADTFGNFTYVDRGSSITITDYPQDATGIVDVPATIAGKPVTVIGYKAFARCAGLTHVSIPSGVHRIGHQAFYDCTNLSSVTIPSSVHNIGDRAFLFCRNLTSVILPSRVNNIGDKAFYKCTGLTNVMIPSSVNSIGFNAFSHCDSLETITVNVANANYASEDGVLFNRAKTVLLQCPAGKKGPLAIPASVTSIASYAFYFCSGLTNVSIPSSVTSIGDQAFNACTGLTSVTLSEGVADIGIYSFVNCAGLTNVTIPSSVSSIGHHAFQSCNKLTSATFLGDAPATGTSVFLQHALGFTVYYQEGSQGFTSPKWRNYQAVALSSAPEMNVQQPAGSSLVDGTAKKSFGTVAVGVTSSAKTFTVTNTGLSQLKALAVTVDGEHAADFTVTPMAKTSLAPGGQTFFKVTFTPSATGTRRAAVHLTSNDANENPFDIQLSGMGVR